VSCNAALSCIIPAGRLLQHMDETPGFETHALQMLVLDEADRILDMGFAATLDAIIANLPTTGRQTLLFSATQVGCSLAWPWCAACLCGVSAGEGLYCTVVDTVL
jgi:hypothetical protein